MTGSDTAFRSVLWGILRRLLIATAMPLAAVAAQAEDAKDCKDSAGIKRFEGSKIVLCDNRKFEEYSFATGRLIDSEDFTRKYFATKLDVEGRAEKNLYVVPKGPSEAEVFRNYEDLLAALGFKPMFKAKGDEAGSGLESHLAKSFKDIGSLMSFHEENQRFGTFMKDEGGAQTYVTIFVRTGEPGSHPEEPIIEVSEGEVLVRVDAIYAGKMKDQMVLVSASDMEKAIEQSGRINLYGILFDFNKSAIKPESRSALDEIGKFLKENPERKLRVIGHTDGVGGADSNLKLSQARATAVVKDLVAKYGVAAGRLKAEGAGMTAPIASNDTEEGRAKNRRVELVAIK